ncbi:WD40-repeat-containing domain protein [Lentinula raphanica]|uniref:WD40-repeat-containing domain protein n=1 Tax=Lentinula raphanica TaxID=153919 RepID=A0AA38NVT2_9AGAR|nr:WD40-repeat-containing domain protein [Lentinula raphanica]
MSSLQTMTNLRYKRYTTFEGLQNAVTSVAISADGKYIVAAGLFGAAVWNLINFESLTLPGLGEKRLCSSAAWLHFDDGHAKTSCYVLILGSLKGDITALDVNEEKMDLQANRLPISRNTVQQVVSLDVQQPEAGNRSHARVVASFADAIVKCWTLSLDGDFQLVFSTTPEPSFLPKTVCFHKESQHVLAFSKEGGICTLLECRTGKVISCIANGCQMMAWVSVDQITSRFVASTGYGFHLFDSNNLHYIRSFAHEIDPRTPYPCQVTFGEDGSKVVGGTDQGEALLFNSHSGLLEQRMKCPTDELIQAVTTCTLKDKYYIAVAGSASGHPSDVIVWCKLRTQTPVHQSRISMKKKADPIIFAVHKSSVIFLVCVLAGITVLVFALLSRPRLQISPSFTHFLNYITKNFLTKFTCYLEVFSFSWVSRQITDHF